MSETTDPFNGKRGRQKGQTKDMVIIRDPLFAPYEIHEDKNCYTLVEPGYNDNMVAVGYYRSLDAVIQQLIRHCLVDKRGIYTFKEYIDEHKKTINSLKQALSI
jgi:hypothetical protein